MLKELKLVDHFCTNVHVPPKRAKYVSYSASAFTLLEVLIALTLVAVLMAAAMPYMADAWHHNASDRIATAITTLVEETRSQALLSGETKFIDLTDLKFLPKGCKIQVERMSDKKFRTPNSTELWQFNSEGICDPLSLRILGAGEPVIMKFDPITGQVVHDE